MPEVMGEARSVLQALVGLKLSIARNAGNMKALHFEEPRRTDNGLVGSYALHIQCPWRLEHSGRIVTGWGDYYIRADNNDSEDWEPGTVTGHLQNQILEGLLQGYDAETRSYTNATERFSVTDVVADSLGGVEIQMTGGYRIVVFPCASRGENWRFFEPGKDKPHLVAEAGSTHLE